MTACAGSSWSSRGTAHRKVVYLFPTSTSPSMARPDPEREGSVTLTPPYNQVLLPESNGIYLTSGLGLQGRVGRAEPMEYSFHSQKRQPTPEVTGPRLVIPDPLALVSESTGNCSIHSWVLRVASLALKS